MKRPAFVFTAAGIAFLLLLLITTFRSTSTPIRQAPGLRAEAQRVCQGSVRAQIPGARFPFDANVEERGTERLRLSGSVDAGSANQTVRRNYQCIVRQNASGGWVTDSVQVWQSH